MSSSTSKIQLNTSSIIGVPLDIPNNEFKIIVNNETFKTTNIIAYILSPKARKLLSESKNCSEITIETSEKGDFSFLFTLLDFKEHDISENQINFILEIIEKLENKEIDLYDENCSTSINNDNIFNLIKKHQQYGKLYSKNLIEDIEYIASHFYELCNDHENDLSNLDIDILMKITSNENLKLIKEDQLMMFINKLCSKDVKYSKLYENVIFAKVSNPLIIEFTKCFDMRDITPKIWEQICQRIHDNSGEKISDKELPIKNRYIINGINISNDEQEEFKGILTFLHERSNGHIEEEIDMSVSGTRDSSRLPKNMYPFESKNEQFASANELNSWICFDFKDKKISPSCYKIRSSYGDSNCWNLLNWVFEGSNDKKNWEVLDKQDNCPYLNGNGAIHAFNISNEDNKEYRCVRVRTTGPNRNGTYYLVMNTFELYGRIITP